MDQNIEDIFDQMDDRKQADFLNDWEEYKEKFDDMYDMLLQLLDRDDEGLA